MKEIIERLNEIPLPELEPPVGRDALHYPGGSGNVTHGEGIKRGVGLAVGYKNVAFSEGFDDAATARVTLSATAEGPSGDLHAAVEMGQGLYTFLAQVARTELEVDEVVMRPNDTLIASAGSTSASRQSMMTGGAVHMACASVREEISGGPRPCPPEGAELSLARRMGTGRGTTAGRDDRAARRTGVVRGRLPPPSHADVRRKRARGRSCRFRLRRRAGRGRGRRGARAGPRRAGRRLYGRRQSPQPRSGWRARSKGARRRASGSPSWKKSNCGTG